LLNILGKRSSIYWLSQVLYLTVSILSAHAAAAPWEGINALDAAVLAYSSISVLRQQIKPDHRVHGIIEGKNWTPNGN
jgi:metal-dependent amidase/aminoacylase/carboxypeptidase family protein